MTLTREARHLSLNDLGKTIQYETDGQPTRGVLVDLTGSVDLIDDSTHQDRANDRICYIIGGTRICAVIITAGEYVSATFGPNTLVTIEGTSTPPGLNLHRSVLDQDG